MCPATVFAEDCAECFVLDERSAGDAATLAVCATVGARVCGDSTTCHVDLSVVVVPTI